MYHGPLLRYIPDSTTIRTFSPWFTHSPLAFFSPSPFVTYMWFASKLDLHGSMCAFFSSGCIHACSLLRLRVPSEIGFFSLKNPWKCSYCCSPFPVSWAAIRYVHSLGANSCEILDAACRRLMIPVVVCICVNAIIRDVFPVVVVILLSVFTCECKRKRLHFFCTKVQVLKHF